MYQGPDTIIISNCCAISRKIGRIWCKQASYMIIRSEGRCSRGEGSSTWYLVRSGTMNVKGSKYNKKTLKKQSINILYTYDIYSTTSKYI